MTQDYKNKLVEILDDTVIKISKKNIEQINAFFTAYNISSGEDYVYFLENHGNDYIKDGYVFRCKNVDDIEYETDMFFGLEETTGNIVEELRRYEQIIPSEVFPIADMPGGDLVCMHKKSGKVFFWFHEENGDNLKVIADSFMDFIMGFEKKTQKERSTKPTDFSINPELDKLLREAAKKYQK